MGLESVEHWQWVEIDQRGEIRICASKMAESDFDFAFAGERPCYHSRHGLNGGAVLNDFDFVDFGWVWVSMVVMGTISVELFGSGVSSGESFRIFRGRKWILDGGDEV
ncbi:hypothetical protein FCV25MIE_00556 [Fagus crenata]